MPVESHRGTERSKTGAGTENRSQNQNQNQAQPPSEDAVFQRLTVAAAEAAQRAYAPYSGYSVGAAALTEDGRLITGCNVENASYGVGLCAECILVGQLQMTGGGKLAAFTCVNGQGQIITPCGRCRQLLNEFAGAEFRIKTPGRITGIEGILPEAFGPQNLEEVSTA